MLKALADDFRPARLPRARRVPAGDRLNPMTSGDITSKASNATSSGRLALELESAILCY